MIEDIDINHPDFARITTALKRGQCPDCDGYGFEAGPRGGLSRNYFCIGCGSGFNIAPVLHYPLFLQRIARRRRK